MEPVRLGYIGCGVMAQKVHLPNFISLPECRIVAIAEIRRELGQKVAARFGIPKLYPSHEELLADPEVEAIAVSGPYVIQTEIARQAAALGKHVFMEKPLAVSVLHAKRLLHASRTGGGRVMVGYMKCYDAGNELVQTTLRQWRAGNKMGRLTYIRAHSFGGDWIAGLDTPLDSVAEANPNPDSDIFLPVWLPRDYACHYLNYLQKFTHNINLLRFLLDAGDAIRVRQVDLDPDGFTGIVILEVAGHRAVLETGKLYCHTFDEHTQIYFEHGWVHTWSPALLHRNAVAEVEIYRHEQQAQPTQHTITRAIAEPRWSWAYKREVEHFINHVRSGEPFRTSAENSLIDVRLFEDIYRTWLNLEVQSDEQVLYQPLPIYNNA